jgi:hypothetical protein
MTECGDGLVPFANQLVGEIAGGGKGGGSQLIMDSLGSGLYL